MQDMVHIRTIATHNYVRLKLSTVYEACTTHLEAFRDLGKEIVMFRGISVG